MEQNSGSNHPGVASEKGTRVIRPGVISEDPPLDLPVGDSAILTNRECLWEIAGISAYSALNACTGSRREARHAGTIHANAATASRVAATAA